MRALSATRIADRRSDFDQGEIELLLTPDVYSVLVQSPGYEPAELPPIRITAGESFVQDPVFLRAGSAGIAGVVTGMPPGLEFLVELRGTGRRPCPRCSTEPDLYGTIPAEPREVWLREQPCTSCGYAETSTRLPVLPSGSFAFDRLVGGNFNLTLIRPDGQPVGVSQVVELPPEQTRSVELQAAGHRILRAEVIDADGRSLSLEWANRILTNSRRHLESVDSESEPRRGDPPAFQCTFRAGEVLMATSILTPPVVGEKIARPSPFHGRVLGSGPRKRGPTDDRIRQETDSLRPVSESFTPQVVTLISSVEGDGLVAFDRVCTLPLTLQITAGPFTASATVPESWDATWIQVRLSRAEPSKDSLESSPRTYMDLEAASAW